MEGGGKEGAEPPFARNTPPLIFPTAGTHPLRTHTRSGLAHDFPLKNTDTAAHRSNYRPIPPLKRR